MDYYQVLRLAPNASRKEIEQAYQRLLKESRYDSSIDRLQIENAYRILSDFASKAHYDNRQNQRHKRSIRLKKQKLLPRIGIVDWIKRRTLPQLIVTLIITVCIALGFYAFRFGYLLQQFQPGDVLYDNISHLEFGKIIRVEENHDFGSKRMDAYQIQLNPMSARYGIIETTIWVPQHSVKSSCYKKEKPPK